MCLKKKKKSSSKLRQKVKVDIVTSDGIKIYYTGKFQDFTARYSIDLKDYNHSCLVYQHNRLCLQFLDPRL